MHDTSTGCIDCDVHTDTLVGNVHWKIAVLLHTNSYRNLADIFEMCANTSSNDSGIARKFLEVVSGRTSSLGIYKNNSKIYTECTSQINPQYLKPSA